MVLSQERVSLEQLGPLLRTPVVAISEGLLTRKYIVVTASLMMASLAKNLALRPRYLLGGVGFVDAVSSQAWLHLRDLSPEDGVIGFSYPRYSKRTVSC